MTPGHRIGAPRTVAAGATLTTALVCGLACSHSPALAGGSADTRHATTASAAAAPRASTAAAPSTSAAAPTGVAPSASASSTAAAQGWLERYWAGEEVISTPDPSVVFVAGERNATCAPLPADRPAGFEGYHFSSDSELRYSPYHGFAADVCHFEWGTPWLARPAARCTRLDPGALDHVYRELRRLEIWKLQMQPAVGANPDRPGYQVTLRWPGHRCELTHRGTTEIVPSSYPAFREVLDLLEAVRRAGEAANPARKDAASPTP